MDDRLYYEKSRNSFFPHIRRQRMRVHQRAGSDKTDTSQNCCFTSSTPVKHPQNLKSHKHLSQTKDKLSKTSSEKREFHTDKSLNTNKLSCNNNVTKFPEGKKKAEKAALNKIKSVYNVEEQTQLANACTRTGDLYSSSATDILMNRNPNKEFDLISHILDESCLEIDLEDRPKKQQVLEVYDDTDERKEETESSFSYQGDNDSITEFDSVSNIGRPLIARHIPPPFEDIQEEDSSSTYVSEYPNYRRPNSIRHRSFDNVRKRRSIQAPELQTRAPFNYFHKGFERPLPKHPSISHLMPHPHMLMDKSNNMLMRSRSRQPIQHWNNAMIPIADDRTNICTRQEPSLEDGHNDDLVQSGKVLEEGNKNPIIRPIPHTSSGASYAHGDEHETSGYISESCPTKDRKRKSSDVTSVINAKRPCNQHEEDLYYYGYQNYQDPRNTPEFGFHSNSNYSLPVPYQQDWSNVYHPSYDRSRQSETRRNIDDPYNEFLRYENHDSPRLLELRRQQMFADNYYHSRADYGCYANFDGHSTARDDHFRPKRQNMEPFQSKKYNLIQENYQHDNPKMFASAAIRSKKIPNERVLSNYQNEEFLESPLEAFKKSEEPILRNDQEPNSSNKKPQAISSQELKNSLLKEINKIPESKTSNSNELALEKDKISDAYAGMDTESSVLLVAPPIQIAERKPKLNISNRRHLKKTKYLKTDEACLVESTGEKPTTETANVKRKVGRPRKYPTAPITDSNHEISDTALTENPDKKSMSENTEEMAKNDQNKCVTRELDGLTTLEQKRTTRHSRRESMCNDESKCFTQMKQPNVCEQRLRKHSLICLGSSTEEETNLLQTDNESSVFERQLSPISNQRPGSSNSVHSTVDYDNHDEIFSSDNILKTIIDDETPSQYEENFDEISQKPTQLDLATSKRTADINPAEVSSKQHSDKSISRSKKIIPESLPKQTSSKANSEDRVVTAPKRDKCSFNTKNNHKETNSEHSNISKSTSSSKSNLNETSSNLRLYENKAVGVEKTVTELKEKEKTSSTGMKLRQGISYLNTIKSCSIKLTKVPIPVPIRKRSVSENRHALNKGSDHVGKEKDATSLPLFDQASIQAKRTNTLATDDMHSKHSDHETQTDIKDKSTDVEAVDAEKGDSTLYQRPSDLAKYATELVIDLTSFDSSPDSEDGSGSDKLRQENTSLEIKQKSQRHETVHASNSSNCAIPSNSSYQIMKSRENYVITFSNLQSVMCPSERPHNFSHGCPTPTSDSSLSNNDRNVSFGSQHKIPPRKYPFILPSVSFPKPSANISCMQPLVTTFGSFALPSASRASIQPLVTMPDVSFGKKVSKSSIKPVQDLENASRESLNQPKSISNSTQNTEVDNVVNEDEPTQCRRSTRRRKPGLLKISENLFCGKKGKMKSQNGKNEKKFKRNSEKEHEMVNLDSRSKLKTTLSKKKLKSKPSTNKISKSFELKSVPMSFVYQIPIKSSTSLTIPQSSSSEKQSAKTTTENQNKKITGRKTTNQTDDKVTLLQTPSPVTGPIKHQSFASPIIQPLNKFLVFQDLSNNTNTQNKPVNFLMSPGNQAIRPSFYLVPCSKSHLFLPANNASINRYPTILTPVLQPPTPVTAQNVPTSLGSPLGRPQSSSTGTVLQPPTPVTAQNVLTSLGSPLGEPQSSTTGTSLSQTQITTSLKHSGLVCSFGCSQTRMSAPQYVSIPLSPAHNLMRSSLGKPKDASLHPLNSQRKEANFPCGINSVQPWKGQTIWKPSESAPTHLKSPSSQPPPFSILKTNGVPSSYEVKSNLTVSQLIAQSRMCNSTGAQNVFCSRQQIHTSIKATLDTTNDSSMLARHGPTRQKETRSSDKLKELPTQLHQCRAELSTEVNKTKNVKCPYSQRPHRVTSSGEKIIKHNRHPVRMTRLRRAITPSSCKETQTSGVEDDRLNYPVMPLNVTNRRMTRLSYRNAQMKNRLSCATISNSSKIGELITMGGDEVKNNKILTNSQNLSQDEPDNTRLHPKTTELDYSDESGSQIEMFYDVPREKEVNPKILPLDKPVHNDSTQCNEAICPSQDESINIDSLPVTANQSIDHSVSFDSQTQDEPISFDRLKGEPISVKKLEYEPIRTDKLEDGPISPAPLQEEPISNEKLGYKPISAANLKDRQISVDKLEGAPISSDKLDTEPISSDQSHVETNSADKLQDEPVSTDMLQNELINADKLGDGPTNSDQSHNKPISLDQSNVETISANQLQDGPISADKLPDEPISTDKLQDKLISSEKVHDELGADNLQDELISIDNLQYKPVDANQLQESGSHENLQEEPISVVMLRGEPISTAKLENEPMGIDKLEDVPIGADKLDNEPISFNHSHIEPICADQLQEEPKSVDKLQDQPISIGKLKDELIGSDKVHNKPISAGNLKELISADKLREIKSHENSQDEPIITVGRLGDKQISTAKLEYEPIVVDKLEEEDIRPDKLQEEPIVVDKLEEEDIRPDKLQEEPIVVDKLEEEDIRADKLQEEPISADNLQDELISGANVQDELISADNLQDNSVGYKYLLQGELIITNSKTHSEPMYAKCTECGKTGSQSQDEPDNDGKSQCKADNTDCQSKDEVICAERILKDQAIGSFQGAPFFTDKLSQDTPLCTDSLSQDVLTNTNSITCIDSLSLDTQLSTDNLSQDASLSTDNLTQDATLSTDSLSQDATLSTDNLSQDARLCTDNLMQDARFCTDNLMQDVPHRTNKLKQDAPLSINNLSQEVPMHAPNKIKIQTQNETVDAENRSHVERMNNDSIHCNKPTNLDSHSNDVPVSVNSQPYYESMDKVFDEPIIIDCKSINQPVSTGNEATDETVSVDCSPNDEPSCTDNMPESYLESHPRKSKDAPSIDSKAMVESISMDSKSNNVQNPARKSKDAPSIDIKAMVEAISMDSKSNNVQNPASISKKELLITGNKSHNAPMDTGGIPINTSNKSCNEQICSNSKSKDNIVNAGNYGHGEPISADNHGHGEPISADNHGHGEPISADNHGHGEPISADNHGYGEPISADNHGHGEPISADNHGHGEPISADNHGHGEPISADNHGHGEPISADNHGYSEPINPTSKRQWESVANFTPEDLPVTANEPVNINNMSCIQPVCTDISDTVPASTILKSQGEGKAFQATINTGESSHYELVNADRIKEHYVQDEPLIVDDSLHYQPLNTDDEPQSAPMNNDGMPENGPVNSDDAQQVEQPNTDELINTGHSPDNEQVSTNDSPYGSPVNSNNTPQDALFNTDYSPNDGPLDNYDVEPLKSWDNTHVLKHDPLVDTDDSQHDLLVSTDESIHTDGPSQDEVVNTYTSPSDATVRSDHTYCNGPLYTVNASHDEPVNTDVLPLVNTDHPQGNLPDHPQGNLPDHPQGNLPDHPQGNLPDDTQVISATTEKPNDPPLNVTTVDDSVMSVKNVHHDETVDTDDLPHDANVTTVNSTQNESVDNDSLQHNKLVNDVELPHYGPQNLNKSQDELVKFVDSKHDVPVNTGNKLHDQPVTTNNFPQDLCASIETTLHDGPLIIDNSTDDEVLKIVGSQHDVLVNRDSIPHDYPVNTDSSTQVAPVSIESLDAVKSRQDESVITKNSANTEDSPHDAPEKFRNSQHDAVVSNNDLLHCTPVDSVRIEESALDPLVSIDDSAQDLRVSTDAPRPYIPTISIYHSLHKQPIDFYKSHNESVNSDHLLQTSTDTTQAIADKSSHDPPIKTDDSPHSGTVDTDNAVNTNNPPHDPPIHTDKSLHCGLIGTDMAPLNKTVNTEKSPLDPSICTDEPPHGGPVDNYRAPLNEAVSTENCPHDPPIHTDELPINTDYSTHDQILNTDNGLQDVQVTPDKLPLNEAVNTDNIEQTYPIDTDYIKIGIMLTPDEPVVKNKMSDEDSVRTSKVLYDKPVSSLDAVNIANRQNVPTTSHTDNYASNDEPLDLSMKSTQKISYNYPSSLPLIPKITTSCVGTMNEDIPLNIKFRTLRNRSFPTISNFEQHKQTGKHSRPTAFPVACGKEDSSKSGSSKVNVRPKTKVKKKRRHGHGMSFWFSRRKGRRTKSAVSNEIASILSPSKLQMKTELSARTLSKVAKKTDLALNPSVHQTPLNSAGQGRTKKTRKRRNQIKRARVATNENLIARRCTRSMSQPHSSTKETLEKETLMQCGNHDNNKRKRHNQLNAKQGNGKRRRSNKQQCQGKNSNKDKSQPLQNVGIGKNIDQTIVAEGETKMRTRSGTKQLPDSLTDKFDQQLIGNLIFDCYLCSRQFFRRSHLESHLKFRHGFPQSETVNEKSNTPDVFEPYKFLGSPQNSSMEHESFNPEQDCNDIESLNPGHGSVNDIGSIKLVQESIIFSGSGVVKEKKSEASSGEQSLKQKFRWENDSSVESGNELDISSKISKRNSGTGKNEEYGVQSAKSRKISGNQTKSVNRNERKSASRNQTISVSQNQTKRVSQRKKSGNQRADCLKLQTSNKGLENSEQNETENILNQNRGVDCVKEEKVGQVTISNQSRESSDLQCVGPVDRRVDCIKEDIPGPSNLGKESSNKTIKSLDSIEPEAKIKVQRGQKWLSCDYCERTFNRKYRYNRHLMVCHSTEKWERKTCEYCNSEFPVGFNLTLHVFMQHSTHNQKAVFSCRFCALTTIHLGAMHTHVQKTHREEYKNIISTSVSCPDKEEIKVVVCKICGTFHRNNRQFESHLLEMHGDVLETQKLEKGGAHRCFLKQNLANEFLVKDANDLYKCLYCPVKFFSEETVSVHITENHVPIKLKEELYRCSFCKYKNKTIHLLKVHMGLHHWEAENFCTVYRK